MGFRGSEVQILSPRPIKIAPTEGPSENAGPFLSQAFYIVQETGRASRPHRLYDAKREVIIYDYVDVHVPMAARMYERRMGGYKAIGYEIGE